MPTGLEGVLVGGTTGTLLLLITRLLLVSPAALESCCFTAVTGAAGAKITTGALPNCGNINTSVQPVRIQAQLVMLFFSKRILASFVGLIKADTLQSRGLRGEIKASLLPRVERGEGWLWREVQGGK